MIKSMTGFGRAQKTVGAFDVTVEIKAVNHKFFEFSSRVPRNYLFLEEPLKTFLKDHISRGKVEAYVTVENALEADAQISINRSFADGYVAALRELAQIYDLRDDISVSTVSRHSDVFEIKRNEVLEDEVTAAVLETASEAVANFVKMREIEGEKLKNDVISRANLILEKVAFVESRSPETVRLYRERLDEKIRDLLGDAQVDEQRLITEVAIFADKVAVAEETVRLRSHISQMFSMLDGDNAIGRKLDFLIQEMNREANTIGSKAQDVEIAHTVVDIKSEIEKIREQIQNIE
ncbi:MAG: YicC family protein [Ruminococcaceae bacterium]|nr:YicC family protein [Oscillospiraceae bacterium]